MMNSIDKYDVIIVGGSYAGLSAAMSLGRSLRKVLIIDSGLPCNRYTPHSHNFLTQDGETPGQIAAIAKEQVLKYPSVFLKEDLAVEGWESNGLFFIETQSQELVSGRKLVFATGVRDLLPELPGFEECWGNSIIHCPYCHGYEYRGQKTAIFGSGDRAFHLAGLIANLTDDLTLLSNGNSDFSKEQLAKLQSKGIAVLNQSVVEFIHQDGKINSILFKDGSSKSFQAVYAVIPFEQHCSIPENMGCELNEWGFIKVDPTYKTSLEGVFACGDATSGMRSVANAVSAGNITGAILNKILVDEGF
jgi:thioredoxin reductase